MNHTIEQIIDDTHSEIVKLVSRWDAAYYVGNEKRYLEYMYSIAEKVDELKGLKRRAKFYNSIEKLKNLLRGE